ncbi:MAG: 5-formyltetrahydrofolate cyclo-ligase [Steroidobacteraceae bacterium]
MTGMPREQIMEWRRAQRERLVAERMQMSVAEREQASAQMIGHLDGLCRAQGWLRPGSVVSGWWPLRGEPDLRPWLAQLKEAGVGAALPLVSEKGAPLKFRLWEPGCRMERGFWNIPQPAEAREVEPDLVLAPGVGFDRARFRLGYGGGYFDRTLAARLATGRPRAVMLAYAASLLDSIHPLPHDIPFDAVVTEQGVLEAAPT